VHTACFLVFKIQDFYMKNYSCTLHHRESTHQKLLARELLKQIINNKAQVWDQDHGLVTPSAFLLKCRIRLNHYFPNKHSPGRVCSTVDLIMPTSHVHQSGHGRSTQCKWLERNLAGWGHSGWDSWVTLAGFVWGPSNQKAHRKSFTETPGER
jgi:hypothetical protein